MRLVLFIVFLAFLGSGLASLPRNERPQTGDDSALKRFLIKYNRMPYSNETVETETERPKVKDWTTCEGCKLLVVELRNIIKNPEEIAKAQELLDRLCNLGILSRIKTECLNMVNNLIVVLHEIEPILDNPTLVCQELQYCPESIRNSITPTKRLALLMGYKFLEALYPGRVKDLPCDECMFAVTELKSLIQSQSIQVELKGELHRICRMAGQYESQCDALVDQYFDLLIQEIVQLLSDARQVCVDVGLCKSRNGESPRTIPLVRLRPAARAQRVHMTRFRNTPNVPQLEAFFMTFKRMQTREGINAGCLVCQAGFATAIEVLSQDRVAAMVTTDVTNFVCALLPDSMRMGCTDFMKIYSRAFLQLILTEFSPPQICSAMGLCKPEDERRIAQLSPTEKSAAVCDACQVLSQYMSFEFQQPDFQQEVVNILKRGCSVLPGDYALQCEDSLVSYVPTALGFVADYLSRNVLCLTLRMCPGYAISANVTTPA